MFWLSKAHQLKNFTVFVFQRSSLKGKVFSSIRITACRDKPGGWRVCAWRRQQSMSLSRHKCAHHVLLKHLVPQCTKMVFGKGSGPWLRYVPMWTVDMTDFSKGKIQSFINSGRTRHPGLNLLSFFLLPFSKKAGFLPLVVKKNPRKLHTKSRTFWVDPPAAGRSFPANPPYSKDLAVETKKSVQIRKNVLVTDSDDVSIRMEMQIYKYKSYTCISSIYSVCIYCRYTVVG